MDNYNQVVIEKVENGFIFSIQTKEVSTGLFGLGNKQVSKKHYIANDIAELNRLISEQCSKLITTTELLNQIEQEDNSEDED